MTTFFEAVPPRLAIRETGDAEREYAAGQSFTALDYALNVDGDFHPITWRAVKGTVFEQNYRQAFPHHDFDNSSD